MGRDSHKAASSKSSGDRNVGQARVQCVNNKEGKYCDLSSMQVKVHRAPKHKLTVIPEQPKRANPYFVTVARAGKAKKGELSGKDAVVEVLSSRGRGDKKTTAVRVILKTDLKPYCSKHKHPLITYTTPSGGGKTSNSEDELATKIYMDDPTGGKETLVGNLLTPVWMFKLIPEEWTFTATACGRRANGKPVGSLTARVHVYPDDVWKLTLKVPPQEKVTLKKEVDLLKGTKKVSVEYITDDKKYKKEVRRKIEAEEERLLSLKEVPSPKQVMATKPAKAPGAKLELRHNGDVYKPLKKITEAAEYIQDLLKTIQKILETFDKIKPQVGWDLDWSCAVFEGTLTGTWGWIEHTDHRAYFAYAIKAKLTIVRIHLVLSFGAELSVFYFFKFLAKLSGGFYAFFSIDCTLWRDTPDKKKLTRGKTTIEGESKFNLTAEIIVGRGDWLSIKGKVETGLKVDGELFAPEYEGPFIKFDVTWTGLWVNGTATIPCFGESEKSFKVFKKKKLIEDGRFPPQPPKDWHWYNPFSW